MLRFRFSTIAKTVLPLQYRSTLSGPELKPFQDQRFSMFLARQPLNKFEIEHINTVMDSVFVNISSASKHLQPQTKEWIDPRLQQAILQFKTLLLRNSLRLTINRRLPKQTDQQPELSGFLRIQGLPYPPKKCIHEVQLNRSGQILTCSPRQIPKKRNTTVKEVVQEVRKKLGKSIETEKIKEQIFNKNDKSGAAKGVGEFLKVFGDTFFSKEEKKDKGHWWSRKKTSETYIQVDQYDMDVSYSFLKNNVPVEEATSTIQTKWLFVVDEKVAYSIRRNKKRILFDIDNWMRGSFIPIKRMDIPDDEEQPPK